MEPLVGEVDEEEWQQMQQKLQEEQRPPKRPRLGDGSSSAGLGSGGSSSAGLGCTTVVGKAAAPIGAVISAPSAASDAVVIPRTVLRSMMDSVERAHRAAQHAVQISQQARNAFEEEANRLSQVAQCLAGYANRGTVL